MGLRAFEVGDQVRVVDSMHHSDGLSGVGGVIGVVRSVDKSRRRTDPYYIYYVELPGEDTLSDFEFRELEIVAPVSDGLQAKD